MGSFGWDDQCYTQYYNGRPLSVALTEPCQCQNGTSPYIDSDFTLQHHHHNHNHLRRSQSSGRRFKREGYSIYRPNVHYGSYFYSPSSFHRSTERCFGGDAVVEKFFTFEEEQCRPTPSVISYVRAASPPVRQIKIRSRPSSCVDLHKREATDNQWKKVIDERHEEHYNYHYNYTPPAERTVTIHREKSPPPPPAVFRYDATTGTDDLHIPVKPTPVYRPATRDASTETIKRPLSISETQVIERYEKDEKIRRDLAAETTSTTYVTMEQQQAIQPIRRTYEDSITETTTSYQTQQQQQQEEESVHRSFDNAITETAGAGYMSRQHQPIQRSYDNSLTGITSSSYKTTAHQQPIQRSYDNALSGIASTGYKTITQQQPFQRSYDNALSGITSSSYKTVTQQQPIQRSYDNALSGIASSSYKTVTQQQPFQRSYDNALSGITSSSYEAVTQQQPIQRSYDNALSGIASSSSSYMTSSQQQPVQHSYGVIEDDLTDKQDQRANTKTHHKEFVQRMHNRNGTGSRSYNSFNTNSDSTRGRTIIRPTARPREALVDTPGITGTPGDISEPTTPNVTFDKNVRSRNYFQTT